ncbi:MAG: FAD-dependent oxidoreductase [Candidatus Thorarchaeota archaeon]
MILAHPYRMEFVSPDGTTLGMRITDRRLRDVVFQIDKRRVLSALADRAIAAGATLRYSTNVTGLVRGGARIRGVETGSEQVNSKMVIAAEGMSRKFATAAGLCSGSPEGYVYILARYFRGLDFSDDELMQKGTLGTAVPSLPSTTGTMHTIGHDQAMVMLALTTQQRLWPVSESISHYLDEYIASTPWLQSIVSPGEQYRQSGCLMVLHRPAALATKGLIAAGDCVAPLGHSSNCIAMLMGREAGLTAAAAVRSPDMESELIQRYQHLFTGGDVFKGVEFEARLMLRMLEMTDAELNEVAACLRNTNLEPFFLGPKRQMTLAALRLMFRPRVLRNWRTIRRLFA